MPHWAKTNHVCCSQMSDRLTGTLFNWHVSPSRLPMATFGYLFPSAKCCRRTLASLVLIPSRCLSLDQQGASEMFRDPRWSDISWNIKQKHEGARERFIRHDQCCSSYGKKKQHVLPLFSQKISCCDLCADKGHKRHHQGKIVKAQGRDVCPITHSGCIPPAICPSPSPSENEWMEFWFYCSRLTGRR